MATNTDLYLWVHISVLTISNDGVHFCQRHTHIHLLWNLKRNETISWIEQIIDLAIERNQFMWNKSSNALGFLICAHFHANLRLWKRCSERNYIRNARIVHSIQLESHCRILSTFFVAWFGSQNIEYLAFFHRITVDNTNSHLL